MPVLLVHRMQPSFKFPFCLVQFFLVVYIIGQNIFVGSLTMVSALLSGVTTNAFTF